MGKSFFMDVLGEKAIIDGATANCAVNSDDSRLGCFRRVTPSTISHEPVVFMFPGGGAQYPGMGRDLYRSEPVFRCILDQGADISNKILGSTDLCAVLYDPAFSAMLQQPPFALAALFVTEYALAKLWMSLGVRPAAMIGHSLGEVVAACLAGVFSFEDGVKLVVLRGKLFEKVEAGGMLSVSLPVEALKKLLPRSVSLAAVNAPELSVVSGPIGEVDRFEDELIALNVNIRQIPLAVPAHSALLEPVLDEFLDAVSRISMRHPKIPFVSNVTGSWISRSESVNPGYWTRHLRSTVQFSAGLDTLFANGYRTFLEVGPGKILSSLAALQSNSGNKTILASMQRKPGYLGDCAMVASALHRLTTSGIESSSAVR